MWILLAVALTCIIAWYLREKATQNSIAEQQKIERSIAEQKNKEKAEADRIEANKQKEVRAKLEEQRRLAEEQNFPLVDAYKRPPLSFRTNISGKLYGKIINTQSFGFSETLGVFPLTGLTFSSHWES